MPFNPASLEFVPSSSTSAMPALAATPRAAPFSPAALTFVSSVPMGVSTTTAVAITMAAPSSTTVTASGPHVTVRNMLAVHAPRLDMWRSTKTFGFRTEATASPVSTSASMMFSTSPASSATVPSAPSSPEKVETDTFPTTHRAIRYTEDWEDDEYTCAAPFNPPTSSGEVGTAPSPTTTRAMRYTEDREDDECIKGVFD